MKALALVALLAIAGCSTVSDEAHHELEVGCSSGAGFYRDWEKLSDVDKARAYWAEVRVLYDLRFSIYGDPIPAPFDAKTWAPKVVQAPPAPQGGSK